MPRSYTIPTKGVHLEFVRQLGTGQFGVANCVRSRRGELYCMKEVKVQTSNDDAREQVLREVNMMKETCDHPNVVAYHDSWFEFNRLCILMEYCANGSLDRLIARFETDKKRFVDTKIVHYMQELSGALKFCHHDLCIMHRDIKPANVLIDDLGTLKLADFGLAKTLDTGLCATFCGSPLYMSPEQCAGESYSFSADVWALGCILYELMALHSPWLKHRSSRQTVPSLLLKIREARPSYKGILDLYPERLIVLTKWMLHAQVERRATARQIFDHLEMRSPPVPTTEPDAADPSSCHQEVSAPVPAPPTPTPVSSPREKTLDSNSWEADMAALVIQRSFLKRQTTDDVPRGVPVDAAVAAAAAERPTLHKVLGRMDRVPPNRRPHVPLRYARDAPRPLTRRVVVTQNDKKSRLDQLAAPRNPPPQTRYCPPNARVKMAPSFGGRKMSPDTTPSSPIRPGWI